MDMRKYVNKSGELCEMRVIDMRNICISRNVYLIICVNVRHVYISHNICRCVLHM